MLHLPFFYGTMQDSDFLPKSQMGISARTLLFLESGCVLSRFSCVQLFTTPVECSPPGSSVHGISRQEYWSGLPCPPPGYLPDPGIKPASLCLLWWQVGSLPLAPPGKLFLEFILNYPGPLHLRVNPEVVKRIHEFMSVASYLSSPLLSLPFSSNQSPFHPF